MSGISLIDTVRGTDIYQDEQLIANVLGVSSDQFTSSGDYLI